MWGRVTLVMVSNMSDRPERLESTTYKARVPEYDAAMYITISEMNGKIREIFINSKHITSFPLLSYLTRTVSRRLQQGEDIQLLIDEMMEIYDTSGGYIIPGSKGFRANSVVAHIGHIVQRHWRDLEKRDSTQLQEAPNGE
jgi:hypothetical protein